VTNIDDPILCFRPMGAKGSKNCVTKDCQIEDCGMERKAPIVEQTRNGF